jgi:hypothetical protein
MSAMCSKSISSWSSQRTRVSQGDPCRPCNDCIEDWGWAPQVVRRILRGRHQSKRPLTNRYWRMLPTTLIANPRMTAPNK